MYLIGALAMKKLWKKGSIFVALILSVVSLAGCGAGAGSGDKTEQTAISVGVTAGPHAEIMEVVKKVAQKDGLDIKIVEFSDYIQPNVALSNGEIDANVYQHKPFLDAQIADRGYKFDVIGKSVIFPMGLYSQKVKSLSDIKENAIVGIPNDPTNGGRALVLLQSAGLLKLKDNIAAERATVADIVENPKKLQIKELEAAQLPRALADMDFAAINTNYAIPAGLSPTENALFLESGESPYANVIVARSEDKDKAALQKLVKAYNSDEVKQFVQEHFKGSATPAW